MIKRLEWDSEFFGYNVGVIDLTESSKFNFKEFKKESFGFTLTYIFSPSKLNYKGLKLADEKVTFLKENIKPVQNNEKNLGFFNIKRDCYKSLEALALESGVYSRFKLDKNFRNNEYDRLYKKWINNTVFENKTLNIVTFKEDEHILGFTTLIKKSKTLCDISLVAVDKNSRGKMIGTKLIQESEKQAFINGFKNIQVVTQKNNKPAVNLYLKCGFKLESTKYIYHYWNL